ncbi:MAG: carbohydrate kinase [Deltaproteobacteria bacterium]|nr:carbohydrate kinase [Deltaproteobacteria bacterium]
MGFTVVAFGEALWDLLPTGPVLGGAPLNFAYRLNSLGHRGIIVSRLGKDDLGQMAREQIITLGMDDICLQWDEAYPTGTVEILFDQEKNPDYTIIEKVAYDHIEFRASLENIVKSADCLCFGTLTQRNLVSRQTLQRLFSSFLGKFRLLDINLRKNCYFEETIKSSLEQANILKLNDEELTILVDLLKLQGDYLPDQAEHLLKSADLKYCVITLGEKGAFALSHRGEKIYSPGYHVSLVDPCGSGDGFAAGFMHALLEGESLQQACRLGNALGAMVAQQKGATQPISYQEAMAFMETGRSGIIDERLTEFMNR